MPSRGRPALDILHEDNHLLVVNKPAGLPTMGAAAGVESLVLQAKAYLKAKYHKPGEVYLGVVSRLDAAVSGAIVLARTSKAAARLSEQFRLGTPDKTYWAVVAPPLSPAAGECCDWLQKDEARQRVVVRPPGVKGAQEARLAYRTLEMADGLALVEVQLATGRKHQIRVQLADRGSPVVGDAKYGSRRAWSLGIALHSRCLAVEHPVQRTRLEFEAPLPSAWRRLPFGSCRET